VTPETVLPGPATAQDPRFVTPNTVRVDNSRPAVRTPPAANLRMYVGAVVLVGGAAVAWSLIGLRYAPHPLAWSLFALLAVVIGSFTINVDSVGASISVADTFFITSALLFGPGPATVAIAVDSLILSWRKGHPWSRIAFNTVAPALSMWVAGNVFFLLARVAPLSQADAPTGRLIAPLLCLAMIYFALNSGLMAVAVGLEARRSPVEIWRVHFLWLVVGYLASASVAFCLILLIRQISLGAVAVVIPVLAVFHLTLRSSFGRLEDAHRHLADVDRLYLSTIETLAMAIDAQDDVTHSHVRRVQTYATGLARALGFTDDATLKAIQAAALLHDTGKLAVPEHILNKPGKLTAAEFDTMKLHVDVGADILSLVEFPYPVVPIVRCHHENWDGTGYPRGVAGEDIPIGARILSVVDCFDALTSDRPYRGRMTHDAALDILRERRGRMYDPKVVDTFIAVYRDLDVAGAVPEHRDVLARISGSRQAAPETPQPPGTPAPVSDDVLAFVSVARLASGEIALSDVLALSSNLFRNILPTATGVWYVADAVRGDLVAVEAFGPSAHAVRAMSVRPGERLTGWVAANRQPIVNSDASLDLGDRALQATPALQSAMSVPLLAGDALVGVLTFYAPVRDLFTEDASRLIQMIAPHVAGAILLAGRARAEEGGPTVIDKPNASTRALRLVAAR
jgi:putative nucleotidyltransferase with HDIG domain